MKPVEFEGVNVRYAEDQDEYLTLPCLVEPDGRAVSCWELSFIDRVRALFSGKVWLHILTHGNPLQPVYLQTDSPLQKAKSNESGLTANF